MSKTARLWKTSGLAIDSRGGCSTRAIAAASTHAFSNFLSQGENFKLFWFSLVGPYEKDLIDSDAGCIWELLVHSS